MILIKLPLFWNIMIVITLVSGIGAFLLLLQAWRDGKEPVKGTAICYEDDTPDESSPENIDFDSIIKIVSLRNKLNKIEEERTGDMNVNYDGYKSSMNEN